MKSFAVIDLSVWKKAWALPDVRQQRSARIVQGTIVLRDLSTGAVVTKSSLPRVVVGGVPTKRIARRYPFNLAKRSG